MASELNLLDHESNRKINALSLWRGFFCWQLETVIIMTNEIMRTVKTAKSDSVHISNFGAYQYSIPCDMDGYTYTTISGWLSARVDTAGRTANKDERHEWAREMALESRKAIKRASDKIKEWQTR